MVGSSFGGFAASFPVDLSKINKFFKKTFSVPYLFGVWVGDKNGEIHIMIAARMYQGGYEPSRQQMIMKGYPFILGTVFPI